MGQRGVLEMGQSGGRIEIKKKNGKFPDWLYFCAPNQFNPFGFVSAFFFTFFFYCPGQ